MITSRKSHPKKSTTKSNPTDSTLTTHEIKKVHKQTLNPQGSDWWKSGVQFECQGSGKCCTSHGEYGFVFLTLKDRKRFADYLKITTREFTKKYCDKYHGAFHLKEDPKNPDCLFLKNKRCSVYEARPAQCRTWPFWPEVMPAKSWRQDVASFCPGIGKGRIWNRKEIEQNLNEQAKAEDQILTGR